VEVFVDAVTVRLTVDGRPVAETTAYATARLLRVPGSARLYLGGVGVASLAAAVDARLSALRDHAAASLDGGCVRNFKVVRAERSFACAGPIAVNSSLPVLQQVVILNTHAHTHLFNGPLSGTTRVSRYQKGKTNLDFTEARDSEWQWHQLGRVQVCTSLQTDNHASSPPLCFLQAGCPSCRPTNSVKALKALKFDKL